MASQIDQSARWRIDFAVSERPQHLVKRAQQRTKQYYERNPCQYLNQLSAPKPFQELLDVSALKTAMQIFGDTIGNFHAFT